RLVLVIIATGLLMRFAQFGATSVLEDDYYRYLWDGAVAANGYSPYEFSPEHVQRGDERVSGAVLELAEASGPVIERINHPWLSTIYPPTAQAAFAAAYWISPFDINGLRIVWLGIDLLILLLLYQLLRRGPQLAVSLAIYWLNPLLVKEVFNAGHMELVLIAALLATLAAALSGWRGSSGALLGLAAGAKVWPVIWLPLLIRSGHMSWLRRFVVVISFALTTGLLALPILLGRLDNRSGFTAYAQRWQMNDSVYMLVHELAKLVSAEHHHFIARIVIVVVMLVILTWLLRRYRPDAGWLIDSVTTMTVALFLLSPTQFPWYYMWVLPLMALRPLWSILALTVTMPLYYLRFPMDAMGYAKWFDYGVVWIEYVPIWLLLTWELRRGAHRRATLDDGESSTCIAANA
ncbi:MAG: glycosyltransferase 87 family protein, partial [Rhodospirillales bacterium]|nr:glycosyltransferase 87 family protein [Rhodospirillales bacterium]